MMSEQEENEVQGCIDGCYTAFLKAGASLSLFVIGMIIWWLLGWWPF